MNSYVLLIGYTLIALQIIFARDEGTFFTRKAMERWYGDKARRGYSFWEHGGLWADILLITPLLAYIDHRYAAKGSPVAAIIVTACLCVSYAFMLAYEKASNETPEAYAHWGQTSAAGRLHMLFFYLALSNVCLFYLAPIEPHASKHDLIVVSSALTPFFFMGVAKWNMRWFRQLPHDKFAIIQSIAGPAVVWTVALIRM